MSGTESDQKSKNKSWKRSLIEWGVFILIAATLYLTGYHTQVIGTAQRGLLATGLITPSYEIDEESMRDAGTEFYFADESFETKSIALYRGKVVFLNIWASWCPPCIAEMPSIASLYEQVKDDENIEFILVSMDEDFEKAKAFMQSRDLDMPIYHYRGRDREIYSSDLIPTTYVITPDGRIAMEKQGMAKYDSPEFVEFLEKLKEL
jgi:thiol-disulfide isomerase/thioredoxin